jgi:hypothetical protein
MRIWSLHPKYLDSRGLVALWRETLLAKHVLEGKTRGYRNHPQLFRFKKAKHPVDCVNQYLTAVFHESKERGYNFNRNKIRWNFNPATLTLTSGQLKYEIALLLGKLKMRNSSRYNRLIREENFEPHPLFKVVEGEIEEWEKIENNRPEQNKK